MMTKENTDSMIIMTDTGDGEVIAECTFSQFCEANCDDPDTIKQVTSLAIGKSIILGGGSAPECLITKQSSNRLNKPRKE